jgi:signal transduction histidine kinase/ligand-binding sensor domain-containing protein
VCAAQSGSPDRYQALDQMHHTAWTAKDGLVGLPNALAQTRDGFLWIGTSDGLFRFDGLRFERYQPAEGALFAVAVSCLGASPDGGLWVGHTRGGATFIAADGRAVQHPPRGEMPVGTVRSIVVDQDGAVWLAAVGGLDRFANGRWERMRKEWNYPYLSAWSLFLERDGTLWVGAASPDRIAFLPKGSRRFVDAGLAASSLSFTQLADSVVAYVPVVDEIVGGIRRHPDRAEALPPIARAPSLAVTLDADGGLWIPGDKLMRVRLPAGNRPPASPLVPTERFTEREGFSGRISRQVLIDREGSVWTISDGGLDRFRRRNLTWTVDTTLSLETGLIADAGGKVWQILSETPFIRGVDDGMTVPGAPQVLPYASLDQRGAVWLSSSTGMFRWGDGSFTQIPPPLELRSANTQFAPIASTGDRSGLLWVSVNGYGVYTLEAGRWTHRKNPDRSPLAARTTSDDRVWLAYRDTVDLIQGDTVRSFTAADGLDITPLVTMGTREREVWVGGERGAAVFDGTRFHRVRFAGGADVGTVSSILATPQGVWLGTSAGIVHLSSDQADRMVAEPGYPARYDLLDVEADLPEPLRAVNLSRVPQGSAVDRHGVVWFLTQRGVARVDPRLIIRNPVPPPVVIRTVTADDSAWIPRGRVVIPPRTRTLRIEYTALSLVNPERMHFRYRLLGWEQAWHESGNRREALYTDLRPGPYTFQVAASNNDGVWNETGAVLEFRVTPAWFQTWWFRTLIALTLLSIAAGVYRARVRRLAAGMAARFNERLAERNRIARELHDTLLTEMTAVAMRLDAASTTVGRDDNPSAVLASVRDQARRAIAEARRAVMALREAGGEESPLGVRLKVAADEIFDNSEVQCTVECAGEACRYPAPVESELLRIALEAMTNARRHARCRSVQVSCAYGRDEVRLRVQDDGVGFDPLAAARNGHFGLAGMRERASVISARLTLESAPGRGTLVDVTARAPAES